MKGISKRVHVSVCLLVIAMGATYQAFDRPSQGNEFPSEIHKKMRPALADAWKWNSQVEALDLFCLV